MSFKDNQDLRPRGEGGWAWDEHELYSVFLPLIGPLGCAVYKAMTRLVPLVAVDPYRYRVSLRQLAEWSGMSKSSVDKQLKLVLKLGMVVETRYLDGRDPSYKLVSLRELAKVGEAGLKKRIGVHHTDTAPFDQRAKHQVERARKAAKRKESASQDDTLLFAADVDPENGGVHHADTTSDEAEDAAVDEVGVHHVDTVSTSRVESSTSEALSSTAYGHPIENRNTETSSTTPLPPAVRGEVGDDDPDQALPSLPSPGCVYGDAGFPASMPVASLWVMGQLGITQRRLQDGIGQQLELWCKRNRGTTLEAAAIRMATAGRKLHDDAHLLRHRPWGWPKFFAQGHWTRPLPYATPEKRTDAHVGMYKPEPVTNDWSVYEARVRTWLVERADLLVSIDGMTEIAAAVLKTSQRFSRANEDSIETELQELQSRVVSIKLESLTDDERAAIEKQIQEDFEPLRRNHRNLAEDVIQQWCGKQRRLILNVRYGIPNLSLAYMPQDA